MAAIVVLLAISITFAHVAPGRIAAPDLVTGREALLLIVLTADAELPAGGVARAVVLRSPRATPHRGASARRLQRQSLQLAHGVAACPLEHLP